MTSSNLPETAAKAREEAHTNLAMAMHYGRLAQGHLEIADDAGAIWDLQCFADHARAALREFKTVRAMMAAPVQTREAAE
jgi:hypothetical protein